MTAVFIVAAMTVITGNAIGDPCNGAKPKYVKHCLTSCGDANFTITVSWSATNNGAGCQNCTTVSSSLRQEEYNPQQPVESYYCTTRDCTKCRGQNGQETTGKPSEGGEDNVTTATSSSGEDVTTETSQGDESDATTSTTQAAEGDVTTGTTQGDEEDVTTATSQGDQGDATTSTTQGGEGDTTTDASQGDESDVTTETSQGGEGDATTTA